jgi:hypothetical protein
VIIVSVACTAVFAVASLKVGPRGFAVQRISFFVFVYFFV